MSTIAYLLHDHRKFVLATVAKRIDKKYHYETLLWPVKLMKSCEKQRRRKNDRIYRFYTDQKCWQKYVHILMAVLRFAPNVWSC